MKILEWLKSLFIHPKEESTEMAGTVATQPVTAGEQTVSPEADVKAGVQDFEAALAFVENGVAQLGAAAKDELKALAVKYL